MLNKILKFGCKILFTLVIFLSCCIIMFKFLNFMETQDDILKIKNTPTNVIENTIVESKTENEIIETQNETLQTQNTVQETPAETKVEEEPKVEETVKEETTVVQQVEQIPVSRGVSERKEEEGWIKFTATYYCPCSKCCGKNDRITASGARATQGVTVAMPKGYALGSKVLLKDTKGNVLNGGNPYIVQDRGGAIQGNRIDIFVDSHQEALRLGRKTVYLKVVN